jgi:hypothetical protein
MEPYNPPLSASFKKSARFPINKPKFERNQELFPLLLPEFRNRYRRFLESPAGKLDVPD